MSSRDWSHADDAMIKRCARAGRSASWAARKLGDGVTRNMVISRARRIPVTFKPSKRTHRRHVAQGQRLRWARIRRAQP